MAYKELTLVRQCMYQGVNVTNTTHSSLMLSNAYKIEVAVVNVAGTGVFSPTILTMIQPSECSVASNALYICNKLN